MLPRYLSRKFLAFRNLLFVFNMKQLQQQAVIDWFIPLSDLSHFNTQWFALHVSLADD